MGTKITWPEGKNFAFTVFDDADCDRLSNTRPVYDFLKEIGVLTTKSVWTLPAERDAPLSGMGIHDTQYLRWIRSLFRAGFEIGWHGARCHSSHRIDTAKAMDIFLEEFGHNPRSMSNHFQNADSIYWGASRLTGFGKLIYRAANFRKPLRTEGHTIGSDYFWGDLCRERVDYVRNFVFRDIDTLAVCPFMPYCDPLFPFVNAWYASAEGGNVESFVEMISEKNQDRLIENGGACIMYTHFAKGFSDDDGRLDPRFEQRMRRLAGLDGWFVPVSTLLDFLATQNGGIRKITAGERSVLQWRWLATKLRHGSS